MEGLEVLPGRARTGECLRGIQGETLAKCSADVSTRPLLKLFSQPLHLGLFRSDYLLHSSASDPSTPLELKQVEFNTISSSFGALSQLAGDLHRYVKHFVNSCCFVRAHQAISFTKLTTLSPFLQLLGSIYQLLSSFSLPDQP